MRALVIGLGSMGKRRARLLRQLEPSAEIVGVDSNPNRREEAASTLMIQAMESLEEALNLWTFEVGFVCTPPLTHGKFVMELLKQGIHAFSELNLSAEGYDAIISEAESASRMAFLSSTQLYRRELRHIVDVWAQKGGPFAYRYHVGQYLPDWHPWESYKDFFVHDRRTNGVREILAIELPWLLKAFGPVLEIQVLKRKLTTLDLDYEDVFMVQLAHADGHIGSLQVDLISRVPVRQLTILSEERFISWQGRPDTLYVSDGGEPQAVRLYESGSTEAGYAPYILEDAYLEEQRAFLEAVKGNPENVRYSYQEDAEVLSLVDRIEAQQTTTEMVVRS